MTSAPEFERRTVAAGTLTIDVYDDADGCAIRLAGELDAAAAPALDHELNRALDGGAAVVLDLARLTFIDSTGVKCLVRAARAAQGSDRLSAVGLQGEARRIFRLTGLDAILPLVA